jgi:hypothetical protein
MSDEPKVGKTFTIDMKVNAWLHYHAKETKRSQSYIVNALLNSAKRRTEIWICSICDAANNIDSKSCYTIMPDGEFCGGVKA